MKFQLIIIFRVRPSTLLFEKSVLARTRPYSVLTRTRGTYAHCSCSFIRTEYIIY